MAKKIFLLFSFIFILILVFSGLCLAQRELEITYPEIPGLNRPTTVKALLPEYIKYIFGFALIIAGLIAFGSLIYGGVRYLTSAGSPSALGDAKDQISSAILGLVVLLCSYLILTTVNPQLVGLTLVRQPTTKGIVLYNEGLCENSGEACQDDFNCPDAGEKCLNCGGQVESFGREFSESLYDELAAENKALKLTRSIPNLRDFMGNEYEREIHSIWFFESWKDITVQLFSGENWEGNQFNYGEAGVLMEANTCRKINFPEAKSAKSINLLPKPPGVYLCNSNHYTDCIDTTDGYQCQACGGKQTILLSSTEMLPPEFNDKIESIMFKNIYKKDAGGNILYDKPILKYGAVLHKDAEFKGAAELFLEGEPNLSSRVIDPRSYTTEQVKKDEVSSVTVFTLAEEGTGEVIFYEEENYYGDYYRCNPSERKCCPYNADGSSAGSCTSEDLRCKRLEYYYNHEMNYTMCVKDVNNDVGIAEESIHSIKINGNYMVMLFDGKNFTKGGLAGLLGKGCTIFSKENDKDFVDNPIGRCGCVFGWGCHSCLSSFIILPIR